jgi:RNA polymerase sigma-70 factor (ECF subfamily)
MPKGGANTSEGSFVSYCETAMTDFETFYRANVRMVQAMALTRTANTWHAEDLTQDTFLRAWQHYHQLSGWEPAAQRAWLVRTLRNLTTDEWRRARLAETAPVADQVSDGATQTDLRLDVANALRGLAELDRDIVLLRYVEGMNSREIGEALGMPEGTVRRRLSESRTALAGSLAQWAPGGQR